MTPAQDGRGLTGRFHYQPADRPRATANENGQIAVGSRRTLPYQARACAIADIARSCQPCGGSDTATGAKALVSRLLPKLPEPIVSRQT